MRDELVVTLSFDVVRRVLADAARVAVRCAVFYPAMPVAFGMAFLAAFGYSPLRSVVGGVYDWAEVAVRPAQVGQVIELQCSAPGEHAGPLSSLCDEHVKRQVSVDEAVQHTVESIKGGYVLLVFAAAVVMALEAVGRGLLRVIRNHLDWMRVDRFWSRIRRGLWAVLATPIVREALRRTRRRGTVTE